MTPDLPTGLAVVTGASSGIGEHFARRLAEAGRPLLLVARREERLRTLADELSDLHGIEAAVHAAELTEVGAIDDVMGAARATGHTLGLVVNNAGFGAEGQFHEIDRQRQLDMVRLNVEALVALTHAALGVLVPQGHGAVLNVASVISFAPAPGSAIYAATKAFVLSFGQALHEELRGSGVTVTTLCPGLTRTEFFEAAGSTADELPEWMAADPDVVARDGLDAVKRRELVRTSGGVNKAAVALMSVLPDRAIARVIGAGQRTRE